MDIKISQLSNLYAMCCYLFLRWRVLICGIFGGSMASDNKIIVERESKRGNHKLLLLPMGVRRFYAGAKNVINDLKVIIHTSMAFLINKMLINFENVNEFLAHVELFLDGW